MERDKLHKMSWVRSGLGAALLTSLLIVTGCSRGFYRKQVDKDVHAILAEKDKFEQWKIENYHVYPNPRARFAEAGNPDRPPMPPDDPAARYLAPAPQKPGKAGVAWVEGTGYLNLLAHWDSQNREERVLEGKAPASAETRPIQPVLFSRQDEPKDKVEEILAPQTAALPCLNPPYLLRLDQAVELGLVNSREYQSRREDLYLAALPVTLERYSFNTQFFAFEDVIRQRSGRKSVDGYGNFWQANTTLGFSKLFSTGALLLGSFANQTVVNLTGMDRHTVSTSQVNLDIIQPLLRGGGRAVTLEPLTLVERNLLYEIRGYARFRKEFFQYITGGGELFELGNPGGIGATSLRPGSLRPRPGNAASPSITPGASGRLDLGGNPVASSEGFLPTLLRGAILRNEIDNVTELEKILAYFRLIEEVGDVSGLQVEQVELDLLRARNTVVQREQELRDGLDRFKLQMGLPTTVPLELDDLAIQPISRQLDRFEEIIEQGVAIVRVMSDIYDLPETSAKDLRDRLRKLFEENAFLRKATEFQRSLPKRWADWEQLTDKALVDRLETIRRERVELRAEKAQFERKNQAWPAPSQARLEALNGERGRGELELGLRRYEGVWKAKPNEKERGARAEAFDEVRKAFSVVLDEALEERLEQVRTQWPVLPPLIVEGANVLEGDLEKSYEVVASLAFANRLDLMNARAEVVDSWRQLAIFANSLLGTFNVGYHVDSITPPGQAKPLAFSGTRTRHQLFFNAELPLVRIAERNAYRASLIAYQRARRELMALEDLIALQVRQELRQLRVLSETYRNQKQSVELAYRQVESSKETFTAPPAPAAGGGGGNTAGNQAALTQQLLNAQRGLPQAQNQLFSIWVNYHIVRQQLFLDLDLLPLDYRGVWIDEYSYRQPSPCLPDTVGQPEWGSRPQPDLERNRARLLPPS